tara:strand:+ start:207 stop:749 length:543 start_codon:yes stop_codon:yes gene_type:complete
MRSSSKSRNRNKNGNRRGYTGGNIINRVFESAGPEGKVRGTPQQIIDKYISLAHDYQLSGDRVAAENFQQHAEHYSRMLAVAQKELAERQADTGISSGSPHTKPSNPASTQSDQKSTSSAVDHKVHINGNGKVDTNLAGCASEEDQNSSDPLKISSQNPSDSKDPQVEEGSKIPEIKKFD